MAAITSAGEVWLAGGYGLIWARQSEAHGFNSRARPAAEVSDSYQTPIRLLSDTERNIDWLVRVYVSLLFEYMNFHNDALDS